MGGVKSACEVDYREPGSVFPPASKSSPLLFNRYGYIYIYMALILQIHFGFADMEKKEKRFTAAVAQQVSRRRFVKRLQQSSDIG